VVVVVARIQLEEVLAALVVRVVAGLVLEMPWVRRELLTRVAAVAVVGTQAQVKLVALAVQVS